MSIWWYLLFFSHIYYVCTSISHTSPRYHFGGNQQLAQKPRVPHFSFIFDCLRSRIYKCLFIITIYCLSVYASIRLFICRSISSHPFICLSVRIYLFYYISTFILYKRNGKLLVLKNRERHNKRNIIQTTLLPANFSPPRVFFVPICILYFSRVHITIPAHSYTQASIGTISTASSWYVYSSLNSILICDVFLTMFVE